MSCENHLLALETEIRHCVVTRDYDTAARLLTGYCQELENTLRSLQSGDEAVGRLAKQGMRLLHWARRNACSARAHATQELRQLPNLVPFQSRPLRQLNTWHLEG
jgi:hypothetical protein